MVVELTDLSEADVSELVAETNLADQPPGTEAKPPAATPAPAAAAQAAWRE